MIVQPRRVLEYLQRPTQPLEQGLEVLAPCATEWEQFPSHVAAPTPAKILAQKLTFIEQFRVRHVAPFACFFRLAEPSETLQP